MEQRAASPVSSCVCVKRNNSMMEPHNSSSGGGTSDPQRGSERAANPAPSCVCMKSDQSKDDPPVFSSGPVTSVLRGRLCCSGFNSEIKPCITPMRAESELQ